MLVVLLATFGGAWWQQDAAEAETARIADVQEDAAQEPEAAPERTATAPARVVDSAGFPAVPESEPQEPVGPIVTVNGRPLNGDRAPQAPQPAAPETVATTPAVQAPIEEPEPQALVAEPPRPIPRPEGLTGPSVIASTAPQRGTVIDYEAIAAAAYGPDDGTEFMSFEQRRALAPLPGEPGYAGYDPRADGLVEVIGPDGVTIWVYEEQLRAPSSGVTFQTRRPADNYGFIYDEEGYRW